MAWMDTEIGIPGRAEKIAARVNVPSAEFRIREVVVKHDLAQRNGIGPGARLDIYGEPFRVVSVRDPGSRRETLDLEVERVEDPGMPRGESRPRRGRSRRVKEGARDA
jgi:hypothetical protein